MGSLTITVTGDIAIVKFEDLGFLVWGASTLVNFIELLSKGWIIYSFKRIASDFIFLFISVVKNLIYFILIIIGLIILVVKFKLF